jgi:signal transduction histidine kinase/ligand-binding sensor domain-containing protein/DNA-binding response OmpR family regulator
MHQDKRGFIWFGTGGGLYKYDGYNFKMYQHNPDDLTSIGNNTVQCIVEDSSGNLWMGTLGGGLNKFDINSEKFTRYLYDSNDSTSLNNNNVHSLLIDHLGILWVGTYAGGLNKVNANFENESDLVFIHYLSDSKSSVSLAGNQVNSLCEDRFGNIWIGTDNGLSKYNRETDNFINFRHDSNDPNSLSNNEILCLFKAKEDNIWIGTNSGGLNKIVTDNGHEARPTFIHFKNNPDDPESINDNTIMTINEDDFGFLWIGTLSGGLNLYNKSKNKFSSYEYNPADPTSISGDIIYSIFKDNSGIIWIGPYNGLALNKFDRLKEQFNPYSYYLSKPPAQQISNVYQIYEDSFNCLWLASYSGLHKFDRNKNIYTNYRHELGNPMTLSNDKTHSICEDQYGLLWIGTHGGGVSVFDRATETFKNFKNDPADPGSLSQDIILDIHEDRYGTIWICTYGGGLNKYNRENNTFSHYTYDPSDPTTLNDNRPRFIYEDRLGNFWIGTWSGGLNKFDREKNHFIHFVHDPNDLESISNNFIYTIYEDYSGNLWIGTDGGLNKFDRGKNVFKRYLTYAGIPNEAIYGILEDDKGNLWISTNYGLNKFDPVTENFRNYDAADGLQNHEYSPHSYFKTRTGELIFGGTYGFNIFHPDSLKDNSHVPPVVITDFQIFNESVPIGFYEKRERAILSNSITETDELELTHEEKIFSIEFAALDFHAPEKNKYAYKMEGFEENWNYTDANRRFVTYTNLDPGDYTFRVKASNNHGLWNEAGASLKIIILPPWWATMWAYLTYVLLIIATIYFVWRTQLKREKIKHEYEMSKFEAEKMHEVDEMKNRFFTNISHEFRTPLTLIFGPAKDVIENTKESDTKHSVSIIKRNASKLYALVNQLLDLSKLEAGKMKLEATEQNIIPLLKGYVLSFSSLAERKKITLKFNSAEDNLNVFVDEEKLEKIVSNLLSNAFKFTPEGGTIECTVNKLDSYTEIRVEDNGIGIAKERLDKIFDRFYQVDGSHTREGEGTGIGLSLTKELVELHKGRIEVESEYGKGTTFKILLPLGNAHLKPEEIVERETTEKKNIAETEFELIAEREKVKEKSEIDLIIDTQKPLLLIVEDNSDVRKYITSHLEKEYRILEASNGEEGLKEAFGHIPDLIISDVMMPKMDGFELCEKIKTDERTSHIPIILLTAKATDKDKISGYETGADDYIMKPFDSNVLKVRIKNLIDQRRKLRDQFRKEGLVEIEAKNITSIDKKFLKNIILAINKHLSDTSFGVETLANETSMSRRNLVRKLTALTGESPGDLIRRARLTQAAKLINQNFGNISEIALEVGFSNPAYFSKCFSEQFGLSPSEYKTNRSK